MQLISKYNNTVRFLSCAIDIFSKYTGVILLKGEKDITITNAFQNIIDESNRKPNKTWVDKGTEFPNKSMKSWLEDIDIKIYSTHDDGKSVIAERFIRILKNKIYKYDFDIPNRVH